MFLNRWLTVVSPSAPSQIQWRNIIYSECNRATRTVIVWIFAVAVILVAFYGMVLFKDYNDYLISGVGLGTKCPPETVTIDVALEDWKKPYKQRQGLTHCYCLSIYNEEGSIDSTVELFQELDSSVSPTPCEAWYEVYSQAMYLTIAAGAMISIINSICVAMFQYLPPLFEKCLTFREEIYL